MTQSTLTTAAPAPLSRQELIDGLKAHAQKNYSKKGAGWDFVIETMTDADIDAIIGKRTKSVLGAVQMMVQVGGIGLLAQARDEAKAAGGEHEEPQVQELVAQDPVVLAPKAKKVRKAKAVVAA